MYIYSLFYHTAHRALISVNPLCKIIRINNKQEDLRVCISRRARAQIQ